MTEEKIQSGFGGGLQAIDFSDVARQIEQAKKKNLLLKGSAIGLVVLSLVISLLLFNYFVLRYAVIENLQVTQDSSDPKKVFFSFLVRRGGVVVLGYEKAISEDLVFDNQDEKFDWTWDVDPSKREFTVYVRSRWWILPTKKTVTFAVSGGS